LNKRVFDVFVKMKTQDYTGEPRTAVEKRKKRFYCDGAVVPLKSRCCSIEMVVLSQWNGAAKPMEWRCKTNGMTPQNQWNDDTKPME
jgi:hypothetical protein